MNHNTNLNSGSQCATLLAHLKNGEGITALDALKICGCFRLAARMADLKRKGYCIVTEMKQGDGCRYAEYRLEE